MKTVKKYFLNILIALDLFVNAIFAGDPKMTVSTRVYLYKDKNIIARWVYKLLNWLDPNHSEDAYEYDKNGADNNNAVLK